MTKEKPEALQAARERSTDQREQVVERDGVRARFVAVPPGLLQDAQSRVQDPIVPMWRDPDKDRELPNPNDPEYLRKRAEANTRRAAVALDAMAMFGIELLDGVPANDSWIKKLKLMEKIGTIDLGWVDWDDETDREFVYKRYIFMRTDDMKIIGQLTGVPQSAITQAEGTFPGTTARRARGESAT